MNRRLRVLVALVFLAAAGIALLVRTRDAKLDAAISELEPVVEVGPPGDAGVRPKLTAVGPKLVSNQTSSPISVHGEHLVEGLTLELGEPINEALPLELVDGRLAYARLPRELDLPDDQTMVVVTARLEAGEGEAALTLVNDADYPDFFALAVTAQGDRYVISPTTDTLYVLRGEDPPFKLKTADGPYAIAVDGDRVWVAHRFSPVLRAYAGLVQVGEVPGPTFASALVVADGVAYVAETARDTVFAIELASGRELWRAPVAPNPGALADCGAQLAVGSHQTGEVELLDRKTGKTGAPISPGPDVEIIGGGTAGFAKRTMGGKAPRALLCDDARQTLFVASIGPNIGPNPEKMEVSMNGGVGVIDLRSRKFVRHLGFGAGITEGLAFDPRTGTLFAADIGLGFVRALDGRALAGGAGKRAPLKEAANGGGKKLLLSETALNLREGFPLAREAADYGVKGRAGVELHGGPRSVQIVGENLYVLNRHSGSVATLLIQGSTLTQLRHDALDEVKVQRVRRTGQVLFFADMGRSAMSCDACHVEGHTEGLLFEKTQPLRIYRSPTVRGTRDTPPYFIPASTFSVAETSKVVGGRNRFHNPDLTGEEIEALSTYSAALAVLPNPFRTDQGGLPASLELPDGKSGSPLRGRALFKSQGCEGCHPPPLFTTDQDPLTRGKHVDVGTPHLVPLREEFQDATFKGFPPPSLLGNWDIWPQLTTGLAGFDVTSEGKLRVKDRYATRAVLERFSGPAHGNAQALSAEDRSHLLAFLLTL